MKLVELKHVPKGEFFVLRFYENEDIPFTAVWIKDCYDRSTRKYNCYKWADVNHFSEMKPNRKVWIDFTF